MMEDRQRQLICIEEPRGLLTKPTSVDEQDGGRDRFINVLSGLIGPIASLSYPRLV